MKELRYGMSTVLEKPLPEAVESVTEALKDEGFRVLTRIDVQATLKERLGADFQPYVILGACNPALAHSALEDDIDIGLLLPCNVVVREEEPGRSIVAILDPKVMARVSQAEGLAEISSLARRKLESVIMGLDRKSAVPAGA